MFQTICFTKAAEDWSIKAQSWTEPECQVEFWALAYLSIFILYFNQPRTRRGRPGRTKETDSHHDWWKKRKKVNDRNKTGCNRLDGWNRWGSQRACMSIKAARKVWTTSSHVQKATRKTLSISRFRLSFKIREPRGKRQSIMGVCRCVVGWFNTIQEVLSDIRMESRAVAIWWFRNRLRLTDFVFLWLMKANWTVVTVVYYVDWSREPRLNVKGKANFSPFPPSFFLDRISDTVLRVSPVNVRLPGSR